tara:strand:- start:9872 stop:11782 length:1911 start_codon:yes stop_codon:yes gene_type:complete
MKKMIMNFITFILFCTVLIGQEPSIQANWQTVGIVSQYVYEVRDTSDANASGPAGDDSLTSYDLTISWPSSDNALFTAVGASFEPGDTVGQLWLPFPTPEALAAAGFLITGDSTATGISLNVDFYDDMTFSINEGSTYPTTSTENCSTAATIPPAVTPGVWDRKPGYWEDSLTYRFGHGIIENDVLALYSAPDIVNGQYGVDYGYTPEVSDSLGNTISGGEATAMPSWGRARVTYTDTTQTVPAQLNLYWEQHPGEAEDSGVDDAGKLNGVLGRPVFPADTVTIAMTAGLAAQAGGTIHVAPHPMLGGPGIDAAKAAQLGMIPAEHADSVKLGFEHDWATGTLVPVQNPYIHGTVSVNHGVYFDPTGGDGIPLNGDEPFAATGHYFTYNFLEASDWFGTTFQAQLAANPADVQGALDSAAWEVADIYVGADTASAISAGVAAALYAQFTACVGTGTPAAACLGVAEAGPTATLNAVVEQCPDCPVNDSDVDQGWDLTVQPPEPTPGRLIFEVDNVCLPIHTTTRPSAFLVNTALLDVEEDAPLAEKFELHGNYPNPFNPVTNIKFSTEMLSDVKVTIYSLTGRQVDVLYDAVMNAGTYNLKWYGKDRNGNKVPSGVYFYEVKSNNRVKRGKMLLLK